MTPIRHYVLAEPAPAAPERIRYFRAWTAIGPSGTYDLEQAQRFATERDALRHPAASFPLTTYRPCPVVGDIVGRPLEWMKDEEAAARKELRGEDSSDGL